MFNYCQRLTVLRSVAECINGATVSSARNSKEFRPTKETRRMGGLYCVGGFILSVNCDYLRLLFIYFTFSLEFERYEGIFLSKNPLSTRLTRFFIQTQTSYQRDEMDYFFAKSAVAVTIRTIFLPKSMCQRDA